MSLLALAGTNSATGGYEIENSLKLEADNTEYLSRTPSSNTNRQTWTFSTWVKRAELGQNARLIDVYVDGQNFTTFGFDTSDRLIVYAIDGGVDYGGHYTPRFRDTSAWYHIIWKSDITNATAANRFQIYVNGVEVTGKDIDYGTPPTNFFTLMNTTYSTKIGYNTDGSNGSSQYMAETHLIDGQALAPTEFGEFDEDTGIWKPKAYTGSYGTNGFYLEYKLPNALGADTVLGGNSNDFTANNITAADQATDTPTNNFCTFNVLQNNTTSGTNPTFTEGATVVNRSTGAGWMTYITTIAVNKGKWYAEFELERTNALQMQGTLPVNYAQTAASTTEYYLGAQANGDGGVGWYGSGSNVYHNGGFTSSTAAVGGDIIGVAVDCDNNKVHFRVNSTWTNGSDPSQGNSGGFAINDELTYIVLSSQPATRTYKTNFGGYTTIAISSAETDENGYGTFEYAPPSGYYALCTKNLEEFG